MINLSLGIFCREHIYRLSNHLFQWSVSLCFLWSTFFLSFFLFFCFDALSYSLFSIEREIFYFTQCERIFSYSKLQRNLDQRAPKIVIALHECYTWSWNRFHEDSQIEHARIRLFKVVGSLGCKWRMCAWTHLRWTHGNTRSKNK